MECRIKTGFLYHSKVTVSEHSRPRTRERGGDGTPRQGRVVLGIFLRLSNLFPVVSCAKISLRELSRIAAASAADGGGGSAKKTPKSSSAKKAPKPDAATARVAITADAAATACAALRVLPSVCDALAHLARTRDDDDGCATPVRAADDIWLSSATRAAESLVDDLDRRLALPAGAPGAPPPGGRDDDAGDDDAAAATAMATPATTRSLLVLRATARDALVAPRSSRRAFDRSS